MKKERKEINVNWFQLSVFIEFFLFHIIKYKTRERIFSENQSHHTFHDPDSILWNSMRLMYILESHRVLLLHGCFPICSFKLILFVFFLLFHLFFFLFIGSIFV